MCLLGYKNNYFKTRSNVYLFIYLLMLEGNRIYLEYPMKVTWLKKKFT